MRIQLESPKSSGLTGFTTGNDEDILMDDEIVAAPSDEEEMVMEADQGTITAKETLAELGITTSEELIKRLKSRDAIGSEGKNKIEVASAALLDTHVPIPKKIFLITDWLLDSIIKNARELPNYKLIDLKMDRKVLAELLVDDRYWKVLERCITKLELADTVLLANRYPLPPLLLSYVYFWRENSSKERAEGRIEQGNGETLLSFFRSMKAARTSKQVHLLDLLNQSLASWLQHSPLFSSEMLYCLKDDEKSIIPFFRQNIGFLELALNLWLVESSKPTNAKKIQDFFLAELLPLHSTAMWWTQNASQINLSITSTSLLDKCRAIIYRISFQSIVITSSSEKQQAVLKAVSECTLKKSLIFLSTYLSQLCLHRKDTQSAKSSQTWIKEGEWRQEIFLTFIAPAIDLLTTSTGEITLSDKEEGEEYIMSLQLLLSTAHRWNLHYSDEAQTWHKILQKVVDFVMTQYSRKGMPASSRVEGTIFRSACMNALIAVHDLDESTFEGERRIRAIQYTLDKSEYEKGGLLDLLCSASIKSRGVIAFVESCQNALERAVLVDTKIASDKLISGRILRTCLFKEEFWHHHLGVAVRDFVSVDDVVQLLQSMLARLGECCSDIYRLSTSKKRKDRKEDSDFKSLDQHFSLAVVQIYFASALLVHLSIPLPAYSRAQEHILSLQRDVIQKHLKWILDKDADGKSDALAAALLVLQDSTQHLAMVCGKEEQEQGGTWNQLATQWDLDLGAHHESLSYMITTAFKHSLELRVQALLSVLHLIARSVERQVISPFHSLLNGSSEIALYKDRIFADLCGPSSGQTLSNMFTIPNIHNDFDYGIEQPAAWSLIVSPFLPIFERFASNELLDSIAFLFVSLIKPSELTSKQEHQAWQLLLSNSSNLELTRWREALCGEIRKEIAGLGDEKAKESIKLLEFFPSDWLSADLRKILLEEKPNKIPVLQMQIQRGANLAGKDLRLTASLFTLREGTSDSKTEYNLATLSKIATASEYEEVLAEVVEALDICSQEKQEPRPTSTTFSTFHKTMVESSAKVKLQTIAILLCNSPEGTLLVSQRCLSTIVSSLITLIGKEDKDNRIKATNSNEEASHTNSLTSIRFVETVLSTKPILFRSADISAVFLICAKLLVTRCNIHSSVSSKRKEFFIHICTTVIECIRLRRDYVSQHLPQLMMLLVSLIQIFQGAAKSKEGSQSRQDLLGLNEAKLFNRLLSTVTAKSTSSSIGGLPESKMKSLAKSFSTHAPYVIVAYVRNLTISSTTIARGELREELTRGIYELCDIIGPWQKNVMMDMLTDEGERIVMRSLWRGWEAQRYKGV